MNSARPYLMSSTYHWQSNAGLRRSKPGRSKYVFVKDPNGYDIEILEKPAQKAS